MKNLLTLGSANHENVVLDLKYANRHGLIAGATGTGKTVSVQVLAEAFADNGVPVFVTDVKGDVSGLAAAGKPHPKIDDRLSKMNIDDFSFKGNKVRFWDILAKSGIPVRLAISDLGPQLLARLLELNDTQEAILSIVFSYADAEGLLLIDLNDLKTSLNFIQEHSSEISADYGKISMASVSAIRRRLLLLEQENLQCFFGEPSINFQDLIQTDTKHGVINILAADKLMTSPKTYATFLLWLLSELFEHLPEIGDPEKPVLALFFDEAHLLFKDTPKVFVDRIEQVVRLIRSKGVGIYFITQSPMDIPDAILGQLGNRIQHALRAYTPKEIKAVKMAAQSFRVNPALDTATVITELGVGEALVSTLTDGGIPSMVQHTLMAPPESQIGPLSATDRQSIIQNDELYSRYKNTIDPQSAHEILLKRREKEASQTQANEREKEKKKRKKAPAKRSRRQGIGEAFAKSVARSLGGALGRKLVRGILGSLLK